MKQEHLPKFAELTDELSHIEVQHNQLTIERVSYLLIENMLQRAQPLPLLLYNLKMVKCKSERERIW